MGGLYRGQLGSGVTQEPPTAPPHATPAPSGKVLPHLQAIAGKRSRFTFLVSCTK